MARILFVVPPLVGHVNPTVSLARELERRGHEVAWVGHAATRRILPEGARFLAVPEAPDDAERYARGAAEARSARGLLAFKMLWEGFFFPLARGMLAGVLDAVTAWGPDLVVCDQQTLAGSLAARRLGLRWATTVTTAAGITDPLAEALPKVHAWLQEGLAALQRDAGLEPIASPDLSPDLVLVFSTEALVGEARRFPAHYRFVGPSIERREETTPFSFDLLRSDVPRVLVSLGTIPAEGASRFHEAVVRAFEPPPARQIVLVAPAGSVLDAPAHFVVRPFVPQLALLARVDAVVCHAGQNTVSEALAHGLPLVVLPIKYDQSVIAQQVADAGAGLRLKFGRVQPAELRHAVDRVLVEPSFREAASRIRASFEAAGGAARGASHLEALL